MNKKGKSFHRPYEIIETEETVTTYFDPSHSKVLTNSTDNNRRMSSQCRRNSLNFHEQSDPKNPQHNGQLQALHEKFNKLRTTLSELTEKFKEINSATLSNLPETDNIHAAEITDLDSSRKKVLQENLDGDDDIGSRGVSRTTVGSQSSHLQPPALNQVIGGADGAKEREIECLVNSHPNQVDAPILNRSKKLLIRLIDEELQRLQSTQKTISTAKANPVPYVNAKQLKMECIHRIARELDVLKDLEAVEGDANHVS